MKLYRTRRGIRTAADYRDRPLPTYGEREVPGKPPKRAFQYYSGGGKVLMIGLAITMPTAIRNMATIPSRMP